MRLIASASRGAMVSSADLARSPSAASLSGDRIGDDELGEVRILDPRDGRAGEDAVGAISDDVLGARLLERGGGVAQGAGRIDDVVDEDAEAARRRRR